MEAARWRLTATLLLLLAAAAAAEESQSARLTFGTTFGTNVKPNNTFVPPTPPPEASLLAEPPRLQMYTSKLSTSGIKPPGHQNNSTQPPPVRGKDCRTDRDCAGLQNATCQLDPRDQKKRCLCFDKSSPQNGACTHSRKGPRSTCSADAECIRNAVCVLNNSTSPSQKMCQCRGDYDDEDHECDSGGMLQMKPAGVVAAVLLVAYHALL